jgi:hypothetical protein
MGFGFEKAQKIGAVFVPPLCGLDYVFVFVVSAPYVCEAM